MLSNLDCIIFPDRCEVIEIIPSQRYFYPIFKNASSSIQREATKSNWKIKINEQIRKLDRIDIVLRDPTERLISGINTFVQFTIRDNPELDRETVIWFAENYLYLNRHYATQFMWIVNLARYMSPTTTMHFLSMDDVGSITSLHKPPFDVKPIDYELFNRLSILKHCEMYQRLDQVIVNHCIGQDFTFAQLLDLLRNKDSDAYNWVINRSQRIIEPIYALSKT